MDTIKFEIVQAKNFEEQKLSFETYGVSVFLNEKKMPHTFFNSTSVLSAVRQKFAEFDLFTCTCGVAGCAGFLVEIIHSVKDSIVEWEFPEKDYYITDKKVYHFVKKDFNDSFSNLYDKMLELEKENIIHENLVCFDYIYDADDADNYVIMDLKESMNFLLNHYENEAKFDCMLKETFPTIWNKNFKYTYEGKTGEELISLSHLAIRLLNSRVGLNYSSFYFSKFKLAVKAILEFSKGDRHLFDYLVHRAFEKDGMTTYDLVYSQFEMPEEDFDIKKLGLIMC